MKILCNKNDLLHALQVTTRALPTTTAIPELTHIHLQASDGDLRLSATNIKTFISTQIDSQVEREGEILVQGQFFLELVHNLREFLCRFLKIRIFYCHYFCKKFHFFL